MEFTVEIVVHARAPLTRAALEELAAIGGAAAGHPGGRRAEATFTVKAGGHAAAVQLAIDKVTAVVPGEVLAIEVMTTEEADRRLEEPPFPRVVGVSEVAELLGVTRQRLAVLREREDFPAPVAKLAGGPIWRAGDLSTFAGGWQRKPGRPRKEPIDTMRGDLAEVRPGESRAPRDTVGESRRTRKNMARAR
jgi:hypothetical protein